MTKKEVIVPADDLVCLGKDTLHELIRCKDCKWWNTTDGMVKGFDGRQWNECLNLGVPTDEWFFCRDGERK